MPSLTSGSAWPVGAPLYAVVAVAMIYHHGGRTARARRRGPQSRLRPAAFYLGLLSIALALDSPLEAADGKLFAAHMAQHVLLLAVAPPLIALGAPWPRLWWPVPLGARRSVARALVHGRWARPLRAGGRALARPSVAWILFNANLVAWHIPAAYDETLRDTAVHDVEHVLFLSTGILFWLHAVDSPPFHARLGHLARVVYLTAGMAVGWVLAIVIALARSPLYPAYASLQHRPGGLSALADQQLAGGVMWVPGSIAYSVAAIAIFYRWLDPGEPRTTVRRAPLATAAVRDP